MALGAITKIDGYAEGNKRVRVVDVILSTGANWTAAGESLTPAMVGLRRITFAECNVATSSTPTGFIVRYDYTNQLLIALAQAVAGAAVALVAVTGGTNLSTFTARIRFEGY
jgi:hypothetical protein